MGCAGKGRMKARLGSVGLEGGRITQVLSIHTYRPDGTQPSEHEGPTSRPCCQILDICKDVMAVVSVISRANWQGNDCGKNQDKIHHYEHGLQLSHDLTHDGREDAMKEDGCKEDCVDIWSMPQSASTRFNEDLLVYTALRGRKREHSKGIYETICSNVMGERVPHTAIGWCPVAVT